MKYIFIAILALVLAGMAWLSMDELYSENRVQQTTINALRERNKAERDSLAKALTATRDSLQIAFETIRQATKERVEAHERTQRIIKNYEKIIFIRYASDSARNRKLSELFPTYVIP